MRLNVQTTDGTVKVMVNTHEMRHLKVAKNVLKALSGVLLDDDDKAEAKVGCAAIEKLMAKLNEEPEVAPVG